MACVATSEVATSEVDKMAYLDDLEILPREGERTICCTVLTADVMVPLNELTLRALRGGTLLTEMTLLSMTWVRNSPSSLESK